MSILISALSLSIYMIVVWLIYLKINNASIVDCAWSMGFLLAAGIYGSYAGWHVVNGLLFLFVAAWALRLALFLFITRIVNREIDKRYQSISEGWKRGNAFGFFWNYQLQALLIFILSPAVYFLAQKTTWRLFDWIFLVWVLVALALEHWSDMTLLRFKQAKSKGVCDKGPWAYSRHPNYFFECCVWFGFALLALDSWWSLLALWTPAGLYLLMATVTGPITEEQSLKSKGEAFKRYRDKTPMIIPTLRP